MDRGKRPLAGIGNLKCQGSRGPGHVGGLVILSVVVIIIAGSLSHPWFLVNSTSNSLPSRTLQQSVSRQDGSRAALELIAELGLHGEIFLSESTSSCFTFTLPLLGNSEALELFQPKSGHVLPHSFVCWEDVVGTSIEISCALALATLEAFGAASWPPAQPLAASVVDRGPTALDRLRAWEIGQDLMEATDRTLSVALRAHGLSGLGGSYLIECAGRVFTTTRPQPNDVPLSQRGRGDSHFDERLAGRPFSRRFTPTSTVAIPRPVAQVDSGWRPMSYSDLLDDGALASITAFLRTEASNLCAMRRYGAVVQWFPADGGDIEWCSGVQRQEPLVIGQDQFKERARGIIWDCRGLAQAPPLPCIPLDYMASPVSDLNNAHISSRAGTWPDHELLSMLVFGVNLRADVPLQLVFCSHLVSLPLGFESVDSEISKFIEKGWYEWSTLLPFVPCRFMSQGSAARKSDPAHFRRTSDGGSPRTAVSDRAGVWAVSLNSAIGLRDVFVNEPGILDEELCKWPAKEIKPRIEDKMHDDCVLRDLALYWFHEPISGFVDDFKSYFNQIPVAPAEYWKLNHIWSAPHESAQIWPFEGLNFAVVSEFRLGFGLSISPNVGQRFAELILHDFRERFDQEEEVLFAQTLDPLTGVCLGANEADRRSAGGRSDQLTDACRWIARRRLLSIESGFNELRAYAIHVYTDDVSLTVVGTDRMIRALRCWEHTTRSFNVEMAAASKRQLGSRLTWLGCNFFLPLGIASAHPGKVLRARAGIDLILEGAEIFFSDYRALLGLLEHLLPIVGGDRTWMYGLYGDNYRRGSLLGPSTRMIFVAAHNERFRCWLRALLGEAGVFFSAALFNRAVIMPPAPLPAGWPAGRTGVPPPPAHFHLFSDAANEGSHGGLGGWAHGEWWHLALSADDCSLMHITSLEFAAVGMNLLTWGPLLVGERVGLYADASTSVQVLQQRAAHSPAMQAIHMRIISLPVFQQLAPSLQIDHVFGELNVFADAASRNRPEVIHNLALQVGIVTRRIPLPPAALAFFEAVRSDALIARHATAAQLATEQQRSTAHPSTYTGDGPYVRERQDDGLDAGSGPAKRISFAGIPFANVHLIAGNVSSSSSLALWEHGGATSGIVDTALCRVPTALVSLQQALTFSRNPPVSNGSNEQGTSSINDGSRSFARLQNAFSDWGERRVSRTMFSTFAGARVLEVPIDPFHRAETKLMELAAASRLGPPLAGSAPASQMVSLGLHQARTEQNAALSPLAQSILMDSSAQALRPRDPLLLREYDALVGAAVQASVSAGTAKKNGLSMKRWCAFVALWGTPPLREDDPALLLTNAFLFASFLIWLAREVRGKGGRVLAKPSTLMGDLYGVKRYHHLHGRRCDAFLLVKSVLKSITNQYAARYGPEALQPVRSEPFSGLITRRLIAATTQGIRLTLHDFQELVPDSWFYHSVRGAIATSSRGGHRKGELVLISGERFNSSHLSWASLFFVISGIIYRYPSASQMSNMKVGDLVGLLPGPCKNDPWGIHFGAHPIYYSFHPKDPSSSGVLLRDMALHCRPLSQHMRSTPLFTTGPSFEPMRHRHLEVVLLALLLSFMSAEAARKYSWHSFRIGLACSLLAAGASDAVIMALCRWRSVSAIRIYARLNSDDYSRFIDDAAALDLSSIQGPNLVPLSPQASTDEVYPIPGSLPTHMYQLLDSATGPTSAELSQEQLHQLVGRIPELDADDFVVAFSAVDFNRADRGTADEVLIDEDEDSVI